MKVPYTATTLRYVHDVVTGEFANVGVLVYAPSARFLQARWLDSFSRLHRFFGAIPTRHLRYLLREIAGATEELEMRLFPPSVRLFDDFEGLPGNALECARRMLPDDDSSLQFLGLSSGLTKSPEATLSQLFSRYVSRSATTERLGRRDDEIWKSFRAPLQQTTVHLEPFKVVTPNYEHEFPYSWRNGKLNVAEPVSFDMRDTGEMLEKANRWVGRAKVLSNSPEPFLLVLLVGEPSEARLRPYAEKAKNILGEISEEKMIFTEDRPEAFANFVQLAIH